MAGIYSQTIWMRVPIDNEWSSFRQRRERRRQGRSIFIWSLLCVISVVTVCTLFLLGTTAAALGEDTTKWHMYIAGNVALLFALVPFLYLACGLFRYKIAYGTERIVPIQIQEHDVLVADQRRNGCRECQPGLFVHVTGDRQTILQDPADDLNISSTSIDSPPSYESATRLQSARIRNGVVGEFSSTLYPNRGQTAVTVASTAGTNSTSAEECSLNENEVTNEGIRDVTIGIS